MVAILATVSGHTYLTNPAAFNFTFRTFHCKGDQCTNACPDILRRARNSPDRPAKIWRRGEEVTVTYTRNTHRGGFLRLSLVPVQVMQSREWHERLTIMHGCWESGERVCRRREECGTDMRRVTFDRKIKIPDVFPNGNYVLGMVWYGGVKRRRGLYPDYYSCSHVRIEGGRLGDFYRPYFEPGQSENRAAIFRGRCAAAVDKIGPCNINGCRERMGSYKIPRAFQNGARPDGYRTQTIQNAMRMN